MGDLQSFSDMTGKMSKEEINEKNISAIIDEMNRNQAQATIGRQINGTDYYYDNVGINYMQIGALPNGTYGWALAKPGNNVQDAFV